MISNNEHLKMFLSPRKRECANKKVEYKIRKRETLEISKHKLYVVLILVSLV